MIPSNTSNVTTQGNLQGQKVAMSVDLSNLSHIMNVLTDLYSNPIDAIVREYTTNAIDSHAMAGQVRPVEIETPTVLRHTLEIQDFGVGMSADEVAEIYGTYGASTKRETNDATGCLGLGSKSALTYTTSFNVRAVKDGKGILVVIYRDDNGAGSMNIVDEFDTDEPNGVRIIIPVDVPKAFEESVRKFTYYVTPGKVLVNGKAPRNYLDEVRDGRAFWANDKTLIVKANGQRNGHHVVMGNVAYPYDDAPYGLNYSSIYFADMGAVDFTPSREALNLTPKTNEVLEDYSNSIGKQLIENLRKELNTYPREKVADFLAEKGWVLGWGQSWVWNGVRLKDHHEFERNVRHFIGNPLESDLDRKIYRKDKQVWLDLYGKPFTPKRKAQVAKYIADNGLDDYHWVVAERPDSPVFDNGLVVTLDDIEKIEVPKQPRISRPVEKPKYQWFFNGTYLNRWAQAELPTGYTQLVYSAYMSSRFARNHPTICFVNVPYNRQDKFKRLYPHAITLQEWQSQRSKELPDFTETELKAIAIKDSWEYNWLFDHKDQIEDAEFKSILDCDYSAIRDKISKWEAMDKYPRCSVDWIEKRYPLINKHYRDESVRYMNMRHKELV